MASVRLVGIKKLYQDNDKKKKGASKNSGDKIAVDDFSLDIKDHEFIVLVGPSGCGKSTTLRMIAGLEEISEGELYIDDKLVNYMAPKDRDIAMVFQNYALYPHMSVYDNMAFSLKMSKMPKQEIDEKVHEAAEILDIDDLLDRKPKALSGGEKQRVAIGRAIVRNPKVLLMDEPLSNLDAKLRNQMRAEIIKLRKKINTTFIYVTHDQVEAMTLGDRIVVMKYGHIQQIGTPHEVFNHPVNMFVAGFIGNPQMNFIRDCSLSRNENTFSIKVFDKELIIPHQKAAILLEKNIQNRDVILGIRPSNVIVSDNGIFSAKLDLVEMMGSETHFHFTICGISLIAVGNESNYDSSDKCDDSIRFDIDLDHINIFDPTTENSLL